MESDLQQLSALLPNLTAQLRIALSNLHLAAGQLAPVSHREQDPALDARAALLDQSYYQLLRLVNNLSALSAQPAEAPPARDTDLPELLRELCLRAEAPAGLRGLKLQFLCPWEHHICAVVPGAVELVLEQLLSNAFKFTPAGGTVTVDLRPGGGERLLLSVADTGCGIAPDLLPTLFDGYLRTPPADTASHGLGLGLTLCRRAAELLEGSLMAESRAGQGSRFTLSIPDRRAGGGNVSDVPLDYTGGFNPTLMALADALPARAFLVREQD